MFKRDIKSIVSVLTVCAMISFAATVGAEEKAAVKKEAAKVETGKSSATVHYKFTNFAAELNNTNLQDFGARVDQAKKDSNVHQLCALALELNMAEKASGKTAGALTSSQLLQSAADLAENQRNQGALNCAAAAMEITGDSAKAANYKKVAMNLTNRASLLTFDLCVNNYDNDSYSIYVDGVNIGEVPPYGKKCGTNVGVVGITQIAAVGWKKTVSSTFKADPYGSYEWKIDAQ